MNIITLLKSLIVVFMAIAFAIWGEIDYQKYHEEGLTFWEAYQRQCEETLPVIVIGMLFIFVVVIVSFR